MVKNKAYICPNCNSDDIEIYDEMTDLGDIDNYNEFEIMQSICCNQCKAKWREYFIARYTGYTYECNDYDALGKEEC